MRRAERSLAAWVEPRRPRNRVVRDIATNIAALLTWAGGWMLRGADEILRWIERHGGPGGCT